MASRNRGRITCPNCRKVEVIHEEPTKENVDRLLATNDVADPRRRPAQQINVPEAKIPFLPPAEVEDENRPPVLNIASVDAVVVAPSSHRCKLFCSYFWVYLPILAAVGLHVTAVSERDHKCVVDVADIKEISK